MITNEPVLRRRSHVLALQEERQKQGVCRQPRRLRLEPLERRELLAISVVDHVLYITGTDAADNAAVWIETPDDGGQQPLYSLHAMLNGDISLFAPQEIDSICFSGEDGDDQFENHTDMPCYAEGGEGDDTLHGGHATTFSAAAATTTR